MVNEEKVSIIYNGNGKTKDFNYPYSFTEGSDIVGYLNNGNEVIKINSNFEFNTSTKTYTYPTSGNPIAIGQSLMLIRHTPINNLVNLPNDMPFVTIERQFDKLTRILQELSDTERNAKTITVLSNQFNAVIPKGKPYAYIRFNKDASAFEVVSNPFEEGEKQLQQIRAVQKTIEVLQSAMNNSITHLNQVKQDFDIGVIELNNMTNSLTAQFHNELNSKLEESTSTLKAQKDDLLSTMRNVVTSGVNTINLNMQELERIKKEVIDDSFVEIRRLNNEVIKRAVEAQASANEAAKSAAAALVSEGNANHSELNAKVSETKSANSEGKAASSAKEANTSAIEAKESATRASMSATTAIKQATEAELSAIEAKRQAERVSAIAGGDLATRSEVKEQVSIALDGANKNLQNHIDNSAAHLDLFDKVSSTAQRQLDSHDRAVDAHVQLFKDVQSSITASYNTLNTNLRQHIEETVISLTRDIMTQLNTKANETTIRELNKKVDTKMPIGGGIFTGNLIVKSGDSSSIALENSANKKFIVEGAANNESRMGTLRLLSETGADIYRLILPLESGILATKENMSEVKVELEHKINSIPKTSIDGQSGNTTLHSIMHRYPDNTSFTGLSNQQWNEKGVFSCYFDRAGMFENQPTTYGQLINLPPSANLGSAESVQLWIEQNNGNIYSRGGNGQAPMKDRTFSRCVRDVDMASWRVVVNAWVSGTNWWREWSDGWIEQGGVIGNIQKDSMRGYAEVTVTYNRAFKENTSPIHYGSRYSTELIGGTTTNARIKIMGLPERDRTVYIGLHWEARGWKA